MSEEQEVITDDNNNNTSYNDYEDENNYNDYDSDEEKEKKETTEEDLTFDADNLSETEAYRILLRICDFLSNTKLTKALELAKQIKGHSLTTLQLYAEIVQVRSSMEDSDESFNTCYSLLEAVEQKSLAVYNSTKQQFNLKREEDYKLCLEATVVLGEINGMMAMMHGRRANRLRAAHKARKSWKFFEEAEKILLLIPQWSLETIASRDCQITAENISSEKGRFLPLLFGKDRHQHIQGDDLRSHYIVSKLFFGSSLFRYGVSMLPPSLQWLIEKFGFPYGDREESIAKLDLISRMPASPRQLLANGALIATKYFFFDEKETALTAVDDMISVYPESIFFRGILAHLQRQEGDMAYSTECFNVALRFAEEEDLKQASRAIRYELANNLFFLGNYQEAYPLYENYLENTTSPTFKPLCAYRLCYCLLMLYSGKELDFHRSRIIDTLKKASTIWVRKDMSYDVYAARLSKQLLQSNLIIPDVTRRLELAAGYVNAKMLDAANEQLEAVLGILESSKNSSDYHDNLAYYYYLRARSLRKVPDAQGAIDVFNTLLSNYDGNNKVKLEKWIVPHAQIELAELLFDKGSYNNCLNIVNSCKRKRDYDFEKQLSFSIKRLERKLNSVPK